MLLTVKNAIPKKTAFPIFSSALAVAAFVVLVLVLFLVLLAPANLFAKSAFFTNPEKLELLSVAREAMTASFEGRTPRPAPANPKYSISRPVAVSIFLDGKLVARTWEIERPGPLATEIPALVSRALSDPKQGRPVTDEEIARAKLGVGVFGRFEQIENEKAVKEGDGVAVLVGFKEGVALPGDLPAGSKAFDLLSLAAVAGGMREGGWLLPDASLFRAEADEAREK
ncbi:MAG: hypothetical protein LBF41_01225 [Deltaproteobacteria bacterium]|jgi:hypothetical protein|nr:hypothetical protein [Deltaproteobacteria bacterium]